MNIVPEQHLLSKQARAAFHRGDTAAFDQAFQEFSRLFPDSAETSFLLGLRERSQQHPKLAADAFAKALAINPERYDAQVELAAVHSVLQDPNKAIELLRSLPPKIENSPMYLNLAGSVYSELAVPEQAFPLFKQALALQPDSELIRANLAACAVFMGEIALADRLYRDLLQQYPLHQRYHYYLARLAKATDTQHIEEMQAVAARFPAKRNVFINFALGKELEDIGQYEESFACYKRANDAAKELSGYRVESDLAIADAVMSSYRPRVAGTSPGSNPFSEQAPIFLVGLPRSGTTLLERILSSHPSISSIGETQYLDTAIRRTSQVMTAERFTEDTGRKLLEKDGLQLAEEYWKLTKYLRKATPFFIEKLPWNFLYVGFILHAIPNAKIVWMSRGAEDSCFAMYKQPFTWAYKYSYNLSDLGLYYRKFREVQEFWNTNCGRSIHFTSYEYIVGSPEESVGKLCEYLGIDFNSSMLEFHEQNKTPSTTASSVQIRSAINRNSIDKWRQYENWLGELLAVLYMKEGRNLGIAEVQTPPRN